MNTEFTVDYFINKFSAIPEEKWFVGDYMDYVGNTNRSCALGHCGIFSPETESLQIILNHQTANINDGKTIEYQQPTPKQRILAALYDIKKLSKEQEVQVSDTRDDHSSTEAGKQKTIIKYVSVSESIKQMEVVLS